MNRYRVIHRQWRMLGREYSEYSIQKKFWFIWYEPNRGIGTHSYYSKDAAIKRCEYLNNYVKPPKTTIIQE